MSNAGHRERVRFKYEVNGFSGMYDYEILEFMLFYAIPRRDTKEIAKELLEKFGKLENVFSADIEELKEFHGIGLNAAIYINATGKLMAELRERKLSKNKRLTKENLKDHLITHFINERTEKLYAVFLDKGNRIRNYKELCEGGIDSLQFDVSDIIREALLQKCTGVILAHNHPGGHISPSDSDRAATLSISQALNKVGITLKDHIIIADGNCYSMAENNKDF